MLLMISFVNSHYFCYFENEICLRVNWILKTITQTLPSFDREANVEISFHHRTNDITVLGLFEIYYLLIVALVSDLVESERFRREHSLTS